MIELVTALANLSSSLIALTTAILLLKASK